MHTSSLAAFVEYLMKLVCEPCLSDTLNVPTAQRLLTGLVTASYASYEDHNIGNRRMYPSFPPHPTPSLRPACQRCDCIPPTCNALESSFERWLTIRFPI
jgi:hypothetical protein